VFVAPFSFGRLIGTFHDGSRGFPLTTRGDYNKKAGAVQNRFASRFFYLEIAKKHGLFNRPEYNQLLPAVRKGEFLLAKPILAGCG
jgi:hypothetical protein